MNASPRFLLALLGLSASVAWAQPAPAPYKVLTSARVGGTGGFDYVFADADGRRLYIPRGNRVTVFDLDTLKSAGEIPEAKGVHGATVDPKTHHGFSSSNPVVMWDTQTLATLKTIPVEGRPDGILFDPATSRVLVLSHVVPNVTVIDSKDGSIVGTIDLGGAPEQGATDGQGRVYIDVEDKANVAVVDMKTLKVTAHYDLSSKASTPAGLALDVKNNVLFVGCRQPAMCVILNAADGKIVTTLPLAGSTDAVVFNPATMEVFSSHGNGTLTVIKESSPTNFAVEQDVQTMATAKTCTLDPKTNRILLIAEERVTPTAPSVTAAPAAKGEADAKGDPKAAPKGGRGPRAQPVPDSFTILAVGR